MDGHAHDCVGRQRISHWLPHRQCANVLGRDGVRQGGGEVHDFDRNGRKDRHCV